MKSFRLGGLIAAPYTPFSPAGDLALGVIDRYAAHLSSVGVKGAFICGTTGEGLSMTSAERMSVAERWTGVTRGSGLSVVVHVGHTSQRDSIELARHAAKVGASATAALSPFFFKPTSVKALVEFVRPIAAAAPELPFYYYNIPSMTGSPFAMADFLELAADKIPNLRGIKYTHGDLMDYQRCRVAFGGRYEIAWGVDEMLLGGLAAGAQSAVGSTYNYAAPVYTRMIAAFGAGDMDTARACSSQAVEFVAVLLKHGVLRTGKATMAMIGLDLGPTRPPVVPLDAAEIAVVRAAYERHGLFALPGNGGDAAPHKPAAHQAVVAASV